ncbi:unnamed protein product, partial [Ectocarpus sp. 12 AP-2014]
IHGEFRRTSARSCAAPHLALWLSTLYPLPLVIRRWRPPPTLTATRCVFELIDTTTPALVVKRKPCVYPGAARHREALRRAKVLTATDPTTLDIRSGDFYKDFAAESRLACLESKKEIRSFDEARARGSEGQPSGERRRQEPSPEAWSPDAAKLSEAAMTAASQPGGLGTGPRVTLSDTYRSLRVLNLAERNITTIDPAFAHFENLTELDLGRNCLRKLENLPEGLVSLSCAANELFGLPDLGTTTPERTRCTDSAAVAATPPASGAGKAGAVRGETAGNSEERGEKEEPPPPQQWGDVEFLVPGDNHDSDDRDSPARTGWFSWASEVVPPPTETPEADNNDGRSEQPHTEQETVDSTAPDIASDGTPWEVSVALPPSREMRDGVRFQGLRVLLFVGDDEREAEGEEEAVEGDPSPSAEAAEAVNDVDSVGVVDGFNSTDEPMHPPGGEGDVEVGGKGEAQGQDRVRPQMLPSRRRRLAGRGHLSLSDFLDPAWMVREQQQPQPQQRQQERGEDVKEAESVVTADGQAGRKTGAPAGMRTLFGVNGGTASPATISGECNVVLEPWVVETMREGVARRKGERLERKEAARAEAEANAANDPKGKNAKAAAAAAAAAKLQEGDEEEEEEEEEIGPSPSARAEVKVTLNSGMASLAVATIGLTAAAPAAADAW